MDAATRDELNALRRRAYGPDADVTTAAPEWARLAELEELAHPTWSAPEPTPDPRAPDEAPVASVASASTPAEPALRRRPAWGGVALATAAAVVFAAATVGSGGALEAADDAAGQPSTIYVPALITPSTGDYVDLSTIVGAPEFPVRGEMAWAQPLGDLYGWSIWIGAGANDRREESCLLLSGQDGTKSRCVSGDARADGQLMLSLPYRGIPADQRPAGMTEDQRVRFLWNAGGYVTVRLVSPVID